MLILKGEHNITQKYNPPKHKGIDIGWSRVEEDNKVYCNCLGEVYKILDHIPDGSSQGGGWGNYVLVKHPNGLYSRYAHLRENLPVKVGNKVDNNTVLGIMGKSGEARGRHLHFEVQTNSSSTSRIDPTKYVYEPIYVEPVPPTPVEPLKPGDKVKIIGEGRASSYGNLPVAKGIGWERIILKIYEGRPYPYRVGNEYGTTGFYTKESLEKL